MGSRDVISLHERKSNINNDLLSIQNNIDQIYNQLVTTDFSQEITITQESLKGELNKYYQERISKQQELIGVVNDINVPNIATSLCPFEINIAIPTININEYARLPEKFIIGIIKPPRN